MVAGAAVLSSLTRRIGVPGVVAYMVAGLVLGPMTGLVEVSEAVAMLSELGVAFLLFLVGLELSVDRVREVGGVALVAGTLQVLLTFTGGFGLALLLGFSLVASVVIGLAVTFSSTAVVVKLLAERRELATRSGRITIGILLVQDIVVVVSLTLLGALGGEAAVESAGVAAHAVEGGAGEGGEGGGGGLVLPFLALGGLCLVAWAAAQTVLPRLFRWISRTTDAVFVWSITWCMLFVVASELVHLPLEIGAFLAGVALAQLPEAHPLARRLGPLTNFFLAIFFVALGIQMDPAAAASQLGVVAILVVFVLVGKSVLLLWILGRTGEDAETAFRTGVSMAQVSEFSFVLAALAAQAGFLDDVALSVIGLVGLVTIAGSSLLLVRRDELYLRFRKSPFLRIVGDGTGAAPSHDHEGALDAHVIVVGMNTLGRGLVERLSREGHEVVAVDRDPEKLTDLPSRTLVGDVERLDVLEEANLGGARLLVSALQIEDTNKLLAHQAHRVGVPSSIHAFNPSVEEELAAAGASHLMDPKHEGARRFAHHLRELGVLASPPGAPHPEDSSRRDREGGAGPHGAGSPA